MASIFDDDEREFLVVNNEEEQYSIWPEGRPVPDGWFPSGCSGPRQTCLEWIEQNWTDMRPKSLRERMDA